MVRTLAKIVLVMSILLMAVPSTQAAPRVEEGSGWSGFLVELWEILSAAFGGNGCWVDPNGDCGDAIQGENGCEFDPDGNCGDAVQGENGCEFDPDGRCRG